MIQQEVQTIPAKTILQKVRYDGSKWFGTDYSMNLYRGCSHGCIYCDSRSACYRVDNFDTVRVKAYALDILRKELRSRRKKGVVGIGAMSDSYNPYESKLEVTRGALKLLEEYGFGLSIETKSTLITRDIDLLQAISHEHSAVVKLTITAADDRLSKAIEPHAPLSSKRFKALEKLASKELCCGVLFTPTLPFITDNENNIRKLVKAAAQSGAHFIYHMEGVTLRDRQRDYFYQKLKGIDPSLPDRYARTFGEKYMCTSPAARENRAIFREACKEQGLLYHMHDIIKAYKKADSPPPQLSLF